MRRYGLVASVVTLLVVAAWGAEGPTTAPTTKPSSDGGELMADKSAHIAYGAETYRLVNEKDEIVSVLRNGMTVITKRVNSPVVAVRGLVGTGGVYEGKWLGGGLSHLLEHLVAGGSSLRRTEAENRNLLQEIGNNSNAYTTEDRTAFFVNTTPPHMEEAVDLVTGWLTGAKITVPEYRREYQVVQRELEMGKGEPDRQFDYMMAMNRYHVSPAKVPVIGYQEVIQGLSRDDVYSYYKLAYEPTNMVFAVVGNLDPEDMLKAVQKNVSDFKPSRVFSHDIAPEPTVLGLRTLVATFPKLGQARLSLGFEGVKITSPDMYPLDLLATVLGSGDSSMLVQELRDKQGLVSGIGANDDTPTYVTGTFSVDMQLDADKVDAAKRATLAMLESLKNTPVSKERLDRAKAQMRVARVTGQQTVEEISTSLADDYMSTGDPHFSDRYLERIAAVTPGQIQQAARTYLYKSRLITTLLLPEEAVGAGGLPKAEELIRGGKPTTKPTETVADSDVKKIALDNGVTVLLKRVTTSPMVQISLYSLGGVTAENADNNGIGNLTMQMLTRGTKTRSAEQIAEFFDSIGSGMDASCGNNSWSWTTSCLTADFDKTMDVYGDIVNHPTFDIHELNEMKQRVEAQIAGEDADWTAQSFRFFKKSYFGPTGNPYQFMPAGTVANVEKLADADLKDWYETKISKGRRVMAIYGDVDPKHAEALAEKMFGGKEKGADEMSIPGPIAKASGPEMTQPVSGPATVTVTDVKVQETRQALAGIVIGFKTDGVIGDPQNYVLDVGQTMAGGWGYPTGYLFETLRGKGLVYVVQDQNNPGRSAKMPGSFFVFAGCEPSKVNEVVDGILLNIGRLQGTPADMQEDWFKRSKLLITTSDAMDNETLANQSSVAALDELFGLGFDYHGKFAKAINDVTLEQIRAAAASKLRQCVVTISTPDPSAVTIKPGERKYDSFPPVDLTPRGVQHSQDVVKP